MIEVEPFGRCGKVIVVSRMSPKPIDLPHLIESFMQIKEHTSGIGLCEERIHFEGVAGQMEGEICVAEFKMSNVDFPEVGTRSRILLYGVAQLHRQPSVGH